MTSVSSDASISIKDLKKTFDMVEAVKGISLEVKSGTIFALLGPNGAGKSTTIKMMTTLLRPTSGSVTLGGYDVVHEQDATRRTFGIVFQDPSLDTELTAIENMRLHAALYGIKPKDYRPRIEQLLTMMDLWERRDSPVKTFSGGMKRRLEIARGLLHNPRILFLDEPTLGLDTQTRNLLWNYVRKLARTESMTIFFTTHYLEEAEDVADRIAIVDHGEIVARGTAAELRSQTKTDSLEAAYLKLTGSTVRDESVNPRSGWKENRVRRMRS